MILKIILCFLCYLFCNLSHTFAENDDKVIRYTAQTFPTEVPKKNHFIMFYAPWCGHCKKLHPTWEELGETLKSDPERPVVIAKVDCTVDSILCSENDVTGYPTLKFFKSGSTEGTKYTGTRDIPSLTSFINQQLGEHAGIIESPVTIHGLTELTELSFNDYVNKGNFFVKFYNRWSESSQKLDPIWKELAEVFDGDSDVGIARVNCDLHRKVCDNLNIKEHPTLLWIKDGKVIETYEGPTSLVVLQAFVSEKIGRDVVYTKKEPKAKQKPYEGLLILNSENFQQGIAHGISFVKFFAPWCGHCKRLAPIWSELDKKVSELSNVRLVKVDCTQENSKDLCNTQEIEGFPTLLLYKNGERIAEYNGYRNLDDMFQFLSKYFEHDEL